MDSEERTRILKEQAKKEARLHEQFSRANRGKRLPGVGLYVAIPLCSLVITLFAGSYYYTRLRKNMMLEQKIRITEMILREEKERQSLNELSTSGNINVIPTGNSPASIHSEDSDKARLLTDDNKKW